MQDFQSPLYPHREEVVICVSVSPHSDPYIRARSPRAPPARLTQHVLRIPCLSLSLTEHHHRMRMHVPILPLPRCRMPQRTNHGTALVSIPPDAVAHRYQHCGFPQRDPRLDTGSLAQGGRVDLVGKLNTHIRGSGCRFCAEVLGANVSFGETFVGWRPAQIAR